MEWIGGGGSPVFEQLAGRFLNSTHFLEVSAHQPLSTRTGILITT